MGGTVWKEAGGERSRVEEARRTAKEGGKRGGQGAEEQGSGGCRCTRTRDKDDGSPRMDNTRPRGMDGRRQ